jgi:hypothetical protein
MQRVSLNYTKTYPRTIEADVTFQNVAPNFDSMRAGMSVELRATDDFSSAILVLRAKLKKTQNGITWDNLDHANAVSIFVGFQSAYSDMGISATAGDHIVALSSQGCALFSQGYELITDCPEDQSAFLYMSFGSLSKGIPEALSNLASANSALG